MKKLILFIILTALHTHAFAINPVDMDVTVMINKKPYINEVIPTDGSVVNEGATVDISVDAGDPNVTDILQYQFIVNGVIRQNWSPSNTFSYDSDVGMNNIDVGVKDTLEIVRETVQIYVFRNTVNLPQ